MKLELYKEYVAALSRQLNAPQATQTDYIDATNALTLVAHIEVLKALYAFNDVLNSKLLTPDHLAASIQVLLTTLRQDIHSPLRRKREDFNLRLFRTNVPRPPIVSN